MAQDAATKNYVDGKVAIVKGTHYWTCAGVNFIPHDPSARQVSYYVTNADGEVQAEADNTSFYAHVSLPQGAVITAVKVYGNAPASAETWTLRRTILTGGTSVNMATANINTEDITITSPTIDNSTYQYYLLTSTLDIGDQIYGARITYTL